MKQSICSICGYNYEYQAGRWKCPACGAFKPDELSPEEQTLLDIANQKLRMQDFSEAEKHFNDIVEKYPQSPFGYWGRLLAKHHIKHERDYDGSMIPTCYAPTMESLYHDKDAWKAIELAEGKIKKEFTEQIQYIEDSRKEWIEKASKEEPYDIFICYKDSDRANGISRTQDSIDAMEIYTHLKDQGYRVFYSRESLRGKSGEKYEPYINHAIATAKVMIVYSLSSEYVMSTWLKNEWTRYQKMIKEGSKRKESLLVVYKGYSPTELPTSLSALQCMDAAKMTFFGDLDKVISGILGSGSRGSGNNTKTQSENTDTKSGKNKTNALACPSCGGNFSASDLTNNDFVTCRECGKVYLISDIFPHISAYRAKKAQENRRSAEEEKKKEQENLRREREQVEIERRRIERERVRLENERLEKERLARERTNRGRQNASYRYSQPQPTQSHYSSSSRKPTAYCNKWVALCLCYFLGFFGVHRFYEGDKKWGKIYLFTFGLLFYGWMFDLIRILFKPTRYPKKNQ